MSATSTIFRNSNEHTLKIVGDLLSDSDRKVSNLIQHTSRIARLRNDWLDLWWLQWELIDVGNKDEKSTVIHEITPFINKEIYEHFHKKYYRAWVNERVVSYYDDNAELKTGDKIMPLGIAEIENEMEHYSHIATEAEIPLGMHPIDLAIAEEKNSAVRRVARLQQKNCKNILSRVRNRVMTYLSAVERQLIFGEIHSTIFDQNRIFVDRELAELCPDAMSKFISAYQRMREDDPESWAQALTSCRRILKSLADVLYPPSTNSVVGSDGKQRVLHEERYVSRLWQYVNEQASQSTSGKLLEAQIKAYGALIDRLYEATCKGIHGVVTRFEVNQCVIQTYMIAADLLRLRRNDSSS